MKDDYPFTLRTCPVCGKQFIPAPQHAWKIGEVEWRPELVCTYSCMRTWEKLPKTKKRNIMTGCGKKVRQ